MQVRITMEYEFSVEPLVGLAELGDGGGGSAEVITQVES